MKKFEYAKNKKNKKSFKIPTIKTKNYNIPFYALPIVPILITCDKISKWYNNRLVWNEKKATKVLDYFLPYVLEFVEEDNAYYYCTSWRITSYDIAEKVPFILRKWTKKIGYYKILQYLKEGYENKEYYKTIEKDFYDTWIKFEKKY